MTEELYLALLEYCADESKKAVRKVSLGESMRGLMSFRLEELGYRELVQTSGPRFESRSLKRK